MIVDKHKLKKELELRPFGQKGWMKTVGRCPFCGTSEKWGILFVDSGGIFNCFKGDCSTKTSVFNYLKQISREDLIDFEKTVSVKQILESIEDEDEDKKNILNIDKKILNLPFRTKIIENDEYLNSRGFLKDHYDTYKPCFTESFIEKRLHNYIIFQIFQNDKLVSWMARSRHSKDWHKENLLRAKEGKETLKLRYINSDNTEFDKILGNSDSITDNTEMVILVEGMFDSVGVDNKLNLLINDSVRCCFTFGNKISDNQIEILRSKKNINTVILFYDYGTVTQMKQYSAKLSRYFDTFIAVCGSENDPSDMSVSEMNDIFSKLQTPTEFFLNNLE